MTHAAAKARFDGSHQKRRAMLGKVHIAKKQLGLDEDDYRQIVSDETGQLSAGDCSSAELDRLLQRLVRLGFKPFPHKGAQHPMAKKARALWISLYHLGEVRNPSDRALNAFAHRQLGCQRLQWARQSEAFRLVEALKAMAERSGWAQTGADGNNLDVRTLREGLCKAILSKLIAKGEVPKHWTLNDAALRLCGIELGKDGPVTVEGYQELAGALGKKLRAAQGGAS